MFKLSKVIRWSALPLSLVATMAHSTINYAGSDTPIGTLSSTPIAFGDFTLASGTSFNDTWTFTIPVGATGGDGYLVGLNLFFSPPSGVTATELGLVVTVDGVPVTLGSNFGFSFSDPPGHYTLDISGTTDVGATSSFYDGAIAAVPEPSTWGLMLAGIAVCAGVARRRVS